MTAKTRTALAQAFSEALKRSGMTQRELARAAGASEARVSRILSAQSNPKIATIAKLAEAMGSELRFTFEPRKEKAR